jgi:amino acid transporter
MGLFYCLVVWAIIQAYGNAGVIEAAGSDPAALFFVAIERYVGAWASNTMYVLIITSVFASQIAFHNAINRYTFTLARDGLLPRQLGHSHPRFGSPSVAGAVQSVLAAIIVAVVAVMGADPYNDLLLKVNTPGVVGIIGLQALTSAAVVAYFVRRRHTVRAPVAILCAVIATVLLSLAVLLLVSHIDLLTNAVGLTNVVLVGIVPLTLIIGVVAAEVLRRQRPTVYACIGGIHPEDGHVPAAEPTDEQLEASVR